MNDTGMHKAICSDCGSECEVPFKPEKGKPVRCLDCFRRHRPQGRFNRGFGDRKFSRFEKRPRQMHKAICSECKKECEVPFKPSEGREIFCQECFMKRKGLDSKNSSQDSNEDLDEQENF